MAQRFLKSPVALIQVLAVAAVILCLVSARERRGALYSSSSLYDDDDGLDGNEDEMRPCPFECDCKGLTVDCSNRGLTYVPKNIPSLAKKVDLRQNEILDVKDGTFQGYSHLEELILFQNNLTATRPGMFFGLKNLKTLLLNSNNISKIHRDTFSGLNNLKLLSLYDNRIETLEEGTFDSLRDIQILHLGKNPFRCDCNLRSLAEYLNGNPIETSGAKCESPKRYSKRKITAVDYNRMGCRDQADQVPVFAKLASSESSRESGDGFPCPDNCSCHGSNIRCGSLEVTAASSTSTSTISYPFFTSSSSTTEDTEDLYLDDHSAAVSSSLPSSVPVDSNELSVLSKRLNRLSKHLNRLSKQMNKLSKQMSECMAAANKTGKHGVKCYN